MIFDLRDSFEFTISSLRNVEQANLFCCVQEHGSKRELFALFIHEFVLKKRLEAFSHIKDFNLFFQSNQSFNIFEKHLRCHLHLSYLNEKRLISLFTLKSN